MSVIIQISSVLRIRVDLGGYDIEVFVAGAGWVLAKDAEISDAVVEGYLAGAKRILNRVRTQQCTAAPTLRCPRCDTRNLIVNQCGCDTDNMPTRVPATKATKKATAL